jgi:hypothetical protein
MKGALNTKTITAEDTMLMPNDRMTSGMSAAVGSAMSRSR